MGYKPPRTLYKLDFSQTEHAGLEVTTRSVSVDTMLTIAAGADELDETTPDLAKVRDVFGRFARVLVSWNVEDDDGRPVPPTADGLLAHDFGFVMAVITAWLTAMTQAPPPLPGGSPSGATSGEASLDLASASRSLPSLPAPG